MSGSSKLALIGCAVAVAGLVVFVFFAYVDDPYSGYGGAGLAGVPGALAILAAMCAMGLGVGLALVALVVGAVKRRRPGTNAGTQP